MGIAFALSSTAGEGYLSNGNPLGLCLFVPLSRRVGYR